MSSSIKCCTRYGIISKVAYEDYTADGLSKVFGVYLNSSDLPELVNVMHLMPNLAYVYITSDTYSISLKGVIASNSVSIKNNCGNFYADDVNTKHLVFNKCCLDDFSIDSDIVEIIELEHCQGTPESLTGKNVEHVIIHSVAKQKHDYLNDLPNLGKVTLHNLYDDNIVDLSKLGVKNVLVTDSQLTSFANIKLPSSLLDLHCERTMINNFDDLCEMPNLISFTSRGTPIDNTRFLSKMPGLTMLEIDSQYITCLDNLPVDLVTLDISGTNVKDPKPITKLINLRVLTINEVPFNDFSFIGNMKTLKTVCATGNNLDDAEFLNNMPNLEDVSLQMNNIINLEPFKTCPKLRKLCLTDNLVYDLGPLNECHALETVYIENNLIVTLKPLKFLENLESIYARNNYLAHVPRQLIRKVKTMIDDDIYDDMDIDDGRFSLALDRVANKILALDVPEINLDDVENYLSTEAMYNIDYDLKEPSYYRKFKAVFTRVWKLIGDSSDRDIIIEILSDDLESDCESGRYYKMLALVSSFIPGFNVELDKKTIVKRIVTKEIGNTYPWKKKWDIVENVMKGYANKK